MTQLFYDIYFFHAAKRNSYDLYLIELNKLFRKENTKNNANYQYCFERLFKLIEKGTYNIPDEKFGRIKSLHETSKLFKSLKYDGDENTVSHNDYSLIEAINNARDKFIVHTDSEKNRQKFSEESIHYVEKAFELLDIAEDILLILKSRTESDLELALTFHSFGIQFGINKLQEVAENFYVRNTTESHRD